MLGAVVYVDIAVLVLSAGAVALYVALSRSSQRKRAQIRQAYLGYAVCALVVALLQLHLYVDGPEILMVFGLFLVPIAVSAAAAVLNTVGAPSAALRTLAGATFALAGAQILSLTGAIGAFMNIIARSYVMLVLFICVYRYREWWSDAMDRAAELKR